MVESSGSQSMDPGNLAEMQFLSPYPKLLNQKYWDWALAVCRRVSPPNDSDASSRLRSFLRQNPAFSVSICKISVSTNKTNQVLLQHLWPKGSKYRTTPSGFLIFTIPLVHLLLQISACLCDEILHLSYQAGYAGWLGGSNQQEIVNLPSWTLPYSKVSPDAQWGEWKYIHCDIPLVLILNKADTVSHFVYIHITIFITLCCKHLLPCMSLSLDCELPKGQNEVVVLY